ncbi:MAG TPA: hypothetical protein VJU15_11240 [Gemmatimonadales bacterium]|nr:hypothetical protein [Gemmatimonadales bacterium]
MLLLALIAAPALVAQDSAARPAGLPGKVHWRFALEAGLGAFGFANSLYLDRRPDPSGDLSDNWFESFVKPGLTATLKAGKGELYGQLSAVGERTFAAPPPLVGREASSFQVEDLAVGWRTDQLDFTVGRTEYKLGHGFLVYDGGGEGGTRGGYWSNARKSWEFAAIARFTPGPHRLEAFYLDREDVPERETGTKLAGLNYELSLGESTTLGAAWIHAQGDPDLLEARDGMNVYNLRAFTTPFSSIPGLSFELEFAREVNGDLLASTGWAAQGMYQVTEEGWAPRVSYRYAYFEGDDPASERDENFDMLFPGFIDWGQWWQGEIAGEYFLSNSNLMSHQVKVAVDPSDNLVTGVIGYLFRLDQPPSFGPGVTSRNVATELDWYADWSLNDNFTVSLVAALAHPQDAVQQLTNRSKSFKYGMVYVSYTY